MLLSLGRISSAAFHRLIRIPTLSPFRLLSTTPSSLRSLSDPSKLLSKSELKTLVLAHYRQGKFQNLLRNVVASPSVLLTACHNLAPSPLNEPFTIDSVSAHFFCIQETASQIAGEVFDVRSCCVTISSSTHKVESLVLPNMKLKVVIEAIRMVLEIVYDDRFTTFSYGGRIGMGRHTAIRYLKNSVENPSWWFSVSFDREILNNDHVDKLCAIIEKKVKDELLINMIKKLFETKAMRIELGGCYLGRGLPQECGLSSILINIYLDEFDKEIQDLRLRTIRKNSRLEINELDSIPSNVFYKPLKIFAVRYLDEILVITSGTKMLTMDLKAWVVNFLEKKLALRVNRLQTVIHSAVSEKINFLGMELRAVTPSVLHPPMTEKAIRARKKYLRRKEVRAMELKNARETNRKKLGMKLLSHCLKKLKQSNGFKFDFSIENEVREIFSLWAIEVVKDFLKSLEQRAEWHRKLSAGDFFSLRRIRDQLPRELVHSYDHFQHQVFNYLKHQKDRKELEEEERREKEEELKYAERTVEDLTRLCIKVDAPMELVRKAVRIAGFTNHMGRPRPIEMLMALEDADIVKWYAGVGRRWLDYFCCCHNFKMLKTVVTYHLRFSCILTLKEKHEATKREVIEHYTKDLQVPDASGNEKTYFPSEKEIKMMGDRNLSDPKPVDGALTLAFIRLAFDGPLCRCGAHFCLRTDTVVYRIRILQQHAKLHPLDEKKWVPGLGAIHECLTCKCLPLCSDHTSELYMGKLTLQDIDCTSLMDVV